MKPIEELEAKIKSLEKENQCLKSLLAQAGIPYATEDLPKDNNAYDPNQGARIIHRDITDADANLFFSMFWGRTDVYSKRTIKKTTGEVNYYTQCYNFWKKGCPRLTGSKIKCQDCERQAYKELKKEQIIAHLKGNAEDATDVIGIYPLLTNDTCRCIVFDFDNREKDAEKHDFANVDDTWKEEVDTLRRICELNDIDALVERSRSGRGAHLWIFFQKPIEASRARKFGNALLQKGAESVNIKSFRYYDRMLPIQDHKKSVIIYDYVDSHIAMFERMYYKRLKACKQIGYDIFSEGVVDKQKTNAIFDIDTYEEIYRQDLLNASTEIIISSPAISGKKVDEMIRLLKPKQESGLKIVIVTWKPDSYGFGDSSYWQELQERMRKASFEMNLVEEYCNHYCIIDREVVWYGSMNFLGKEDAEDNLMRVVDRNIAAELLELTFGNEVYYGETM